MKKTLALLLTAVMLLVFFVLGRLDQPVVLGAVLGSGFAILNFFVLGLSVQKSVASGNATRGKLMMTLSYSLRMLAMMGVVVLGLALPYFSWVTVVLPPYVLAFMNEIWPPVALATTAPGPLMTPANLTLMGFKLSVPLLVKVCRV